MSASTLRLQAQIFNLGVQSNLIYRWNFLLRVLVSFVPLLGSVFLWNAVFAGEKSFAGYTFESMVAYFITLILVDTLTVPNEDDFQIAEDIRDGRINTLLLKPIDYRLYRFHLYAAARIVHATFAVVPLGIAMIWLGQYYSGLPWLVNLPLALLATAGAALIQFFFCFALAMIAFWILDIGSITFIIYSVEFLLGGHIFPVDAFPRRDFNRPCPRHQPGLRLSLAVGVDRIFLRPQRHPLEARPASIYGRGRVKSGRGAV